MTSIFGHPGSLWYLVTNWPHDEKNEQLKPLITLYSVKNWKKWSKWLTISKILSLFPYNTRISKLRAF